MGNKSLIVSEKGLFYKIKIFFKSIFNNNEITKSEINGNYNTAINQEMKKSY